MGRKKFIRRNWDKYKRLGRKRLLKWRRPRGKHNKMRKRRAGYPTRPEIGMKKHASNRVRYVKNMKELLNIKKNEEAILAKVGKRKMIEMLKKADELGVKILNKKR